MRKSTHWPNRAHLGPCRLPSGTPAVTAHQGLSVLRLPAGGWDIGHGRSHTRSRAHVGTVWVCKPSPAPLPAAAAPGPGPRGDLLWVGVGRMRYHRAPSSFSVVARLLEQTPHSPRTPTPVHSQEDPRGSPPASTVDVHPYSPQAGRWTCLSQHRVLHLGEESPCSRTSQQRWLCPRDLFSRKASVRSPRPLLTMSSLQPRTQWTGGADLNVGPTLSRGSSDTTVRQVPRGEAAHRPPTASVVMTTSQNKATAL